MKFDELRDVLSPGHRIHDRRSRGRRSDLLKLPNISAPEDRNVSESVSVPVSSVPEEHISTASWAEICDNSPSVHQLPQVANPWLPRTTSLGRRKPAPVVSTAPQWKPTRPSLVGAKNPDDSEDMDTQPSSLKRKDLPPDS